MKVRKKLSHPTFSTCWGRCAIPQTRRFRCLALDGAETRELIAAALAKLGTTRSLVVHRARWAWRTVQFSGHRCVGSEWGPRDTQNADARRFWTRAFFGFRIKGGRSRRKCRRDQANPGRKNRSPTRYCCYQRRRRPLGLWAFGEPPPRD